MNESFNDQVLQFVLQKAKEYFPDPVVYFFGSRANNTNSSRSDYDFAINTNGSNHANWVKFILDVDENAPTLLKLDLIQLDNGISPELKDQIFKTGKRIL